MCVCVWMYWDPANQFANCLGNFRIAPEYKVRDWVFGATTSVCFIQTYIHMILCWLAGYYICISRSDLVCGKFSSSFAITRQGKQLEVKWRVFYILQLNNIENFSAPIFRFHETKHSLIVTLPHYTFVISLIDVTPHHRNTFGTFLWHATQ